MTQEKHTPKSWSRGTTLLTRQTKAWPKSRMEENDRKEQTMLFSSFYPHDEGRSRQLVATLNEHHPEYEENAKLMTASPDLLSALQNMTEQFRIGELNVKKDYSKMVAHAAAIKAIRKATGDTP